MINKYPDANYTAEGHLEVEVHGPSLPFGSLHVESLHPVFQSDPVYGFNAIEDLATVGNAATPASNPGVATAANQLFTCSTNAKQYGFATIQSRRRVRYRPGQGVILRFTGMWHSNCAATSGHITIIGTGTAESGFYFGYYKDPCIIGGVAGQTSNEFGILHTTGGVRKIVKCQITAGATAAETITITLNGVAQPTYSPGTISSVGKLAYDLSKQSYYGWKAEAVYEGGQYYVYFLANDAGVKGGSYTLANSGGAATAAGTFSNVTTGVASTDTFIPKSTWNGESVSIDPTKGNVFQIGIQYLGFGCITFKVETCTGSTPEWTTVHTIKPMNNQSTTNVSQPSFPFTMAAYSSSTSTEVSVSCASYGGFTEGIKKNTGPRISYKGLSTAISATNYYNFITISNPLIRYNLSAGTYRANQAVINLLSFGGSIDYTRSGALYLIKNATLANPTATPVQFTAYTPSSVAKTDTTSATSTITNMEQGIFGMPLAPDSGGIFGFTDDVTVQPGETITVCANTVSGTATSMQFILNTREDH